MNVKQIYGIANTVTSEVLGRENVINEDLSNLVEVGDELANKDLLDKYTRKLINHIGKVVFVDRPYDGRAPRVLMDGWEFGSILEKVRINKLAEAQENPSWELQDGDVVEMNMFTKLNVTTDFWNELKTMEVPLSIGELQVKQSFSSREQMNSFFSMVFNWVRTSIRVKLDALIMRTINNFIGETLYAEAPDGTYTGRSGAKAINLLYLYNTENSTTLTPAQAIKNESFLKFAAYTMGLYVDYLQGISSIFNIKGADKFTPKNLLHVVMLSNFAKATDVYLQSNTFHNELTKFPEYETVPYWQGSGKTFAFNDVSKIDIKTSGNHDISLSHIMCVMFDRDALGVTNQNSRVKTHDVSRGEFMNYWYKEDVNYFNAQDENFVVFYLA